MIPTWAIWIVLCGIFLIGEIFTVSFLLFWPGIGAFLAFITYLLGFSLKVQIMKPLVKKLFKTHDTPMNSDAIIGKHAIVIKKIDNLESTGQVKVNGELWSALSDDDEIIDENSAVEIVGLEGVKLKVKKI